MVMQKIINEAGAFVDEMLEGLLLAHPGRLRAPARRACSCAPTLPVRARWP